MNEIIKEVFLLNKQNTMKFVFGENFAIKITCQDGSKLARSIYNYTKRTPTSIVIYMRRYDFFIKFFDRKANQGYELDFNKYPNVNENPVLGR